MELSNVFYSKTYSEESISTREYLDFIEGRKIAQELLEWHHRQFEILGGDGHPIRIFDVQRSYLRQQVLASARYLATIDDEEAQEGSGSGEAPRITSEMFKKQIESTFDYASELLAEETIRSGRTYNGLGWSPEIQYTVRTRPTPLPSKQGSWTTVYYAHLLVVRRPVPEGKTAADRVYGRSHSERPDSTVIETSDKGSSQTPSYRLIVNSKDAPRLRKRRKM